MREEARRKGASVRTRGKTERRGGGGVVEPHDGREEVKTHQRTLEKEKRKRSENTARDRSNRASVCCHARACVCARATAIRK